jgi:hypothetical protein
VAVLVLGAPAAAASTFRVCPTSGSGCSFTSIQAAINEAPGGSTISVAPGTYKENLTVGPNAGTPLKIVGDGDLGSVVIDGQKKGSVLVVTANKTVNLVRLVLTNGFAEHSSGGGIANIGGIVSVSKSRITNNTATATPQNPASGFGGGIFNFDGSGLGPQGPTPGTGPGRIELVGTLVADNHALRGGGISTVSFVGGTHAVINESTIAENTASGGGAGGVENCGTLIMRSSVIRGNTSLQGAGLTNCFGPPQGNAQLTNTRITGNHAIGTAVPPGGPPMVPPGHGGGISNGGILTLTSSPVSNNTAKGPGGGIFNVGTVTLNSSPVTNNTSPGGPAPGGIFNVGSVTRSNSPVTGNTPPQCGPAPFSC